MKARVATAWLGGCSGCHMSLLDMDERIIDLADKIDLVYSPLIDIKEFPENVDVTLVEGSVNDSQNEKQIHLIRDRTQDSGCPRRLRSDWERSLNAELPQTEPSTRAGILGQNQP